MSKKQSKTQGLEWLMHSLNAFNGSGYADMDTPEAFIDSYIAYKSMRKQTDAVRLAEVYRPEAIGMIITLLERTNGAGRSPTDKNRDKFNKFRNGNLPQSKLL